METDQPNETTEEKPKTRKIKKQVRKGDLPLSSGTASLDEATKAAAAEKESAMFMEDKLVADTEEKKNELESYIYEMRGKIDDQYAEFSSDEEKEKVKAKLEASEVSATLGTGRVLFRRLIISNRIGFTTRARMPPKLSTLPRLKRSGSWQDRLCRDTTTRLRRKGKRRCKRSRRPPQHGERSKKQRGRPPSRPSQAPKHPRTKR